MDTPEFVQISLERYNKFLSADKQRDEAVESALKTGNIYSKMIIDLLTNLQIPAGLLEHSYESPMKVAGQIIEVYNVNPKGKYYIEIKGNSFVISEKKHGTTG